MFIMNFNRINLFHFICTQLKYYRILIPIIYIFTLDCIIFVVMIRLDRAGIYGWAGVIIFVGQEIIRIIAF